MYVLRSRTYLQSRSVFLFFLPIRTKPKFRTQSANIYVITVCLYFILLKEDSYVFESTLIIGEVHVFRKFIYLLIIQEILKQFLVISDSFYSQEKLCLSKWINSWVKMVEQNQITYLASPVVTQHPFLGQNLAELEALSRIHRRGMPFQLQCMGPGVTESQKRGQSLCTDPAGSFFPTVQATAKCLESRTQPCISQELKFPDKGGISENLSTSQQDRAIRVLA